MIFNNRNNAPYKVAGGKIIYDNRSPTVEGIILTKNIDGFIYVLGSKRGPGAADYQGYWNLIAGYLDWDETGSEAIIRETWEEAGLNLPKLLFNNQIIRNDLYYPWNIVSNPKVHLQNVSLRYGIYVISKKLPELNTKNNEVSGEVSDLLWMPIQEINNYKWAFNHHEIIRIYLKINKIKI